MKLCLPEIDCAELVRFGLVGLMIDVCKHVPDKIGELGDLFLTFSVAFAHQGVTRWPTCCAHYVCLPETEIRRRHIVSFL